MAAQLFDVPATEQEPRRRPICGGKRFRDVPAPEQLWLEARSLNDLVAPDDQVRAVRDIVECLDVSALEQEYRGGGGLGYPPRYVLTIMVYAFMTGVRAAHEMARRCKCDVRFMWLAGGLHPSHDAFSDFRRLFGEQIKDLFKQTIVMGMAAGLITAEQVSIDGSKIAAHAKRKALSQADIEKLVAKLDADIVKLMAEAEALDAADEAQAVSERADKIPAELVEVERRRERLLEAQKVLQERGWDRVSETDQEAPVQKTQDGKRPGYNAQISVDAASGMVVAQELTDAQNDTQQLAPLLDQTISNTGFRPDVAAADTGYASEDSLRYLESAQVNGYVKQQAVQNDGRFDHTVFDYDAERDLYLCPCGHELPRKKDKTMPDGLVCQVYRSSSRCCRQCERRAECISLKAEFRQLVRR